MSLNSDKNPKIERSIRKRKRRHCSSDEDEFDTSIDAKLKQSAMRNNLTPQNVKNILQKVVRNDHVLAIVKLKEEELERRERAMKTSKSNTTDDSVITNENTEIASSEDAVPKLTRSKAKALNKYPLPLQPFKHSEPDSEVVALIHEELHSDDDDEEYQPGEDDIESDDDMNTTTSDIDSQPATPSSQTDTYEEPSCKPIYSQDGIFKVPRARNDSTASHSEQEYIIAQRTRSKISLAETPIEAIESTFRAPDAPSDIYQIESDVDPIWNQFLNNFSMPLTSETEKDEDTDPDYCPVIVDGQLADREEFQCGNVSKKEVNDLWNELFGYIDINFLESHEWVDPVTLDSNPTRQATTTTEAVSNESLVTPVKQTDEAQITPEVSEIAEQRQTEIRVDSPVINNSNISYFDPNAISTPARPNFNISSISSSLQVQQQSINSFNSTLLSINESSTQNTLSYSTNSCSFSPLQQNNMSVFVPVVTFTTSPTLSSNKFSLPIQITLPTEAITTKAIPSTIISSMTLNSSNNQMEHLKHQIDAGPALKRPGCKSKRSRFKSAAYKELENLSPYAFERQNFISPDERGFTIEQRRILENQLRRHVQLSTQSYLQTYGHPEFFAEAHKIKRFLTDFAGIVNRPNEGSVSIYNLESAIELINNWENELSQDTKDNSELITYWQNEMAKLRNNMSYKMQFHERFLRVICESHVFIYPELLPAIPFRFHTKKSSEYFPAEDYLLSFLLEHFFDELRYKSSTYKLSKPKEITLTAVCQNISAHLGYLRHFKSIYDYVRMRRDSKLINPIKFYFQHKRAPPLRHYYEIFNPKLIIEPAKQPLTALSEQWARYVRKFIGFSHDEVLNTKTYQSEATLSKSNVSQTKNVQNVPQNKHNENSLIQVKIIYEHSDVQHSTNLTQNYKTHVSDSSLYESKCDLPDCSTNLIKGQTLLTSYFHPIQNRLNEKNSNKKSYSFQIDDSGDFIITDDEKPDRKLLNWYSRKICKKYIRLHISKYLIRQKLQQFFVHLACKVRKLYLVGWNRFQRNKNVSIVFHCLISYHQFTTAFLNRNTPITIEKSIKMTTEALVSSRRIHKLLNENVSNVKEINDEHAMHMGQHQTDSAAKRLPRNQRTSENARLLLLNENAQESSEKDFLFAQRYLDRVEETFINENRHTKFAEFLEILRSFGDNQHRQSGSDLYLILEKFFLPDYPELMELFLYFLLPSDAVVINKSLDYFLKINLAKFLYKLNIFFQKQPAQVRKVLACLKELSEDQDVTIDRIRSKVLPLLKGNQLLIDWFLQCIGPDKCDSSKEEYETLMLRKGNESIDDDQFEYIPQNDILPDPNENPCHIRYLNGRIFYGNRFPLPAKLSFGAMPCSSISTECVQEETPLLLIGNGDKTMQYNCVHNIKEFADSKMRDRYQSELEHNNCGAQTEENSDEEPHYTTSVDKINDKNCLSDEIEQTSQANTSHVNKHILCDNTLLRAHSIRLNPSLHAPLLHLNADLLNKLRPQDQLSAENVNKEPKLSPKKQAIIKCSTSSNTKTTSTRKIPSPNAKKSAAIVSKSPNSKKTISPISLAPENIDCGFSGYLIQESNAIQTAKKLKRIIETNESSSSPSNLSNQSDESKRSNIVLQSNKNKSHKSHMLSKPIKKQKRAQEFYECVDKDENIQEKDKIEGTKEDREHGNQKLNAQLEIQWTREEDRLLLEQIRAGIDFHMENISGFADRFPQKTQEQIRDRIDFLIDFLTKLRNKK